MICGLFDYNNRLTEKQLAGNLLKQGSWLVEFAEYGSDTWEFFGGGTFLLGVNHEQNTYTCTGTYSIETYSIETYSEETYHVEKGTSTGTLTFMHKDIGLQTILYYSVNDDEMTLTSDGENIVGYGYRID